MWEGVGDGVSRESIWIIVQNTLDPLGSEVVGLDLVFEILEAWFSPVIVEYRYERVVIGDNDEVGETCEEQLSDGP